jgi:peptidoglycan/LPS O-acetylase OafA/YrhL
VPVLDGLRGVAILLVLITHFCVFSYRPFVDLVFMKVAALGWIGVDLFFVLSGYLITGLLSDAKGKPWYFRTFYARRVLRIFPLYYGFLVVLFLVVPLLLSDRPALVQSIKHGEGWYWTYAVNIFLAAGEWEAKSLQRTGHFWSLAIEEQFYLLWPLVVLICRRRTLMWVCAGAILSSFLIRCGMLAVHATPDMVYLLLPSRMDDLAVGAAIALGARNPRGLTAWFRPALIATGVAGAGLSGIVILDHGFDAFGMPMQTVGYTLLAVVLGGVLLIALVTRPPLLADSRLVFFGRYSYGIYVLHPLCLSLLPWLGFSPDRFPTLSGSHIPGVLVFASVAISVSVGFALISWHCYEKHFLKLKRWFPYRHALVEQAAVPALDPHGSFPTASSRLGQASDG